MPKGVRRLFSLIRLGAATVALTVVPSVGPVALAGTTTGACPASTSPQNRRTITFFNNCGFDVWVGGQGTGVPSSMTTPPSLQLAPSGHQSFCVQSPCPSCSYSPATGCIGSSCSTGYSTAEGFRSAPVTVAEIAQGGTIKAGVIQSGVQSSLSNQFLGHAWIQPGSVTIFDTSNTINATDNGSGGFTGTGFSSASINYTTGNVSMTYNNSTPSNDKVEATFTYLG